MYLRGGQTHTVRCIGESGGVWLQGRGLSCGIREAVVLAILTMPRVREEEGRRVGDGGAEEVEQLARAGVEDVLDGVEERRRDARTEQHEQEVELPHLSCDGRRLAQCRRSKEGESDVCVVTLCTARGEKSACDARFEVGRPSITFRSVATATSVCEAAPSHRESPSRSPE